MCMCIEFVIQVLNQKNAYVSFPVGMVMLSGECCEAVFPGTVCWTRSGNAWTASFRIEHDARAWWPSTFVLE